MLLTIDSETAVFLTTEGNLVHLSGVLDEAPDSKEFYYSLLTENFKNSSDTGYYRYAIDPDSRSFIISLTVNTERLEQSEFIDYFKLFIENSEKWVTAMNRNTHDLPNKQDIGSVRQSIPERNFPRV